MLPGRYTLRTLSAVMFLLACGGGDGGTDPTSGLNFPPLDAAVRTLYCIRGNTTVNGDKSGSITASDCDSADFDPTDDSYFETWRFRVAQATTVTFTVDAPAFDSYIEVVEATVSGGDITNILTLGEDDDTNGDDPVLTLDLVPDTDYAVVVSGYDYGEVGAYTLIIN